jgi:FkbM family methyltransferase
MIKSLLKKILPASFKIGMKSFLVKILGQRVVSNDMFDHLLELKRLGYGPECIIDVGAYKGEWTSKISKIYPQAQIFMLEAQPDKEKYLKEIAQKNPNIKYQIALLGAKVEGSVQFYKMETGSSVYSEQTDAQREVVTLEMKTLDSVASTFSKENKALLKLDVQGAEIDILEGAGNILPSVEFILLEASVLNYNKNAPLIGEIFQYLNGKGFILFDICEQKRTSSNVLMQVDLLFTKKHVKIRKENNFYDKFESN